jgi:Leu/Phe-tRNA-protein transferase
VSSPALASGGRIYSFHQNMITGHVSARQKGFFAANPVSGAMQHWSPSGRCILFAGDLAAKKRVERVARHAGGRRRRGR